MEEYGKNEGFDMNEDREEVYSKAVKAGKRTYFFDVKATRNNDYYLTITESKKKFDKDGVSSYEKHKIFLYKEFREVCRRIGRCCCCRKICFRREIT